MRPRPLASWVDAESESESTSAYLVLAEADLWRRGDLERFPRGWRPAEVPWEGSGEDVGTPPATGGGEASDESRLEIGRRPRKGSWERGWEALTPPCPKGREGVALITEGWESWGEWEGGVGEAGRAGRSRGSVQELGS